MPLAASAGVAVVPRSKVGRAAAETVADATGMPGQSALTHARHVLRVRTGRQPQPPHPIVQLPNGQHRARAGLKTSRGFQQSREHLSRGPQGPNVNRSPNTVPVRPAKARRGQGVTPSRALKAARHQSTQSVHKNRKSKNHAVMDSADKGRVDRAGVPPNGANRASAVPTAGRIRRQRARAASPLPRARRNPKVHRHRNSRVAVPASPTTSLPSCANRPAR